MYTRSHVDKHFLPDFRYVFKNPFFITRRFLYQSIAHFAPNFQGGRLLDVGCGTKPYRPLFSVNEYVGLDYTDGARVRNPNADLHYDGGRFPVTDASFDYVLATEVLEHVFEPNGFVQEIHRALKPGGLLLLTVPFVWDEHEAPWDYARYTSFGVRHLMEKHGFVVVEQRKTGGFLTTLTQLFCLYLYYGTYRRRWLLRLTRALVMAPLQLLALGLARILPTSDGLYLDNVLLLRKPAAG